AVPGQIWHDLVHRDLRARFQEGYLGGARAAGQRRTPTTATVAPSRARPRGAVGGGSCFAAQRAGERLAPDHGASIMACLGFLPNPNMTQNRNKPTVSVARPSQQRYL